MAAMRRREVVAHVSLTSNVGLRILVGGGSVSV